MNFLHNGGWRLAPDGHPCYGVDWGWFLMRKLQFLALFLFSLCLAFPSRAQTVAVYVPFTNLVGTASSGVTRITISKLGPGAENNGAVFVIGDPITFTRANTPGITNGVVSTNLQAGFAYTIEFGGYSVWRTNLYFPLALTNLAGPFNAVRYVTPYINWQNGVAVQVAFAYQNEAETNFLVNLLLPYFLSGGLTAGPHGTKDGSLITNVTANSAVVAATVFMDASNSIDLVNSQMVFNTVFGVTFCGGHVYFDAGGDIFANSFLGDGSGLTALHWSSLTGVPPVSTNAASTNYVDGATNALRTAERAFNLATYQPLLPVTSSANQPSNSFLPATNRFLNTNFLGDWKGLTNGTAQLTLDATRFTGLPSSTVPASATNWVDPAITTASNAAVVASSNLFAQSQTPYSSVFNFPHIGEIRHQTYRGSTMVNGWVYKMAGVNSNGVFRDASAVFAQNAPTNVYICKFECPTNFPANNPPPEWCVFKFNVATASGSRFADSAYKDSRNGLYFDFTETGDMELHWKLVDVLTTNCVLWTLIDAKNNTPISPAYTTSTYELGDPTPFAGNNYKIFSSLGTGTNFTVGQTNLITSIASGSGFLVGIFWTYDGLNAWGNALECPITAEVDGVSIGDFTNVLDGSGIGGRAGGGEDFARNGFYYRFGRYPGYTYGTTIVSQPATSVTLSECNIQFLYNESWWWTNGVKVAHGINGTGGAGKYIAEDVYAIGYSTVRPAISFITNKITTTAYTMHIATSKKTTIVDALSTNPLGRETHAYASDLPGDVSPFVLLSGDPADATTIVRYTNVPNGLGWNINDPNNYQGALESIFSDGGPSDPLYMGSGTNMTQNEGNDSAARAAFKPDVTFDSTNGVGFNNEVIVKFSGGISSYAGTTTLAVTGGGLTNSSGVNLVIGGFTGTSVTQYDNQTNSVSLGTITSPTLIILQPRGALKGSSCAASSVHPL